MAPIDTSSSQRVDPVEMGDHSPTRVADFTIQSLARKAENSTSCEDEALDDSTNETYFSLKPRSDVFLPTLMEAASTSTDATEEADRALTSAEYPDEIEMYQEQGEDDDDSAREEAVPRAVKTTVKTTKEEFMKLKAVASNLAARGRESEALKTYNRALRLMRTDLSKIKKSMKNALQTTIASLQSQLYKAWIQVAKEIAEIRTIMAILCERLGNYERAITSCEEAKIVYQSYAHLKTKVNKTTGEEQDQVEQMEHMLERLSLARDTFPERRRLHEQVIKTQRHVTLAVDPDLKEALYADLFQVLYTALQMEEESLGEMHPQVADTIAIIANVHADRKEMEDALEKMYSSVSIMRLALGPQHPRTAAALRNLGRLYEMRGRDESDYDRAIELFQGAIEAFQWSSGAHHSMVGSTLNNIAVIHIRRKNFDAAVEKLSDALTSYEAGIEHGNGINAEVAQVWKNLGECYSLRGEWESALFAYTSALGVQQDARRCYQALSDTSDDDSTEDVALKGADDASMADTLLRLAKATTALGQYDGAVETYEEALHTYRLMLHRATVEGNGHVNKEMVDAQERLAHTLYCIAEVQEKNVQYDEAMAIYSEAFDLRLRSDAVREDKRANMVHCAMCLAGIGSVHMRKYEFTDACLVLKESLHFLEAHGVPKDHEIFDVIAGRLVQAERGFLASSSSNDEETIVSTSADTTKPKEDRALKLDKEAQDLMESGDYEGAIRTLTTALAIRRKRLTKRLKGPVVESNLKEKNDVAKTIGNFAAVLFMQGELKQAESLFTEAIRVYRSNGMADGHPCIQDLLYGLKRVHEC